MDKSYTHPNRIGNRCRALPEVTSDEDASTPKTPGRLPMSGGWAKQDQLKLSWSKSRTDEPCQYDQMSDQPLPLETQFSGIANMSNGEF